MIDRNKHKNDRYDVAKCVYMSSSGALLLFRSCKAWRVTRICYFAEMWTIGDILSLMPPTAHMYSSQSQSHDFGIQLHAIQVSLVAVYQRRLVGYRAKDWIEAECRHRNWQDSTDQCSVYHGISTRQSNGSTHQFKCATWDPFSWSKQSFLIMKDKFSFLLP